MNNATVVYDITDIDTNQLINWQGQTLSLALALRSGGRYIGDLDAAARAEILKIAKHVRNNADDKQTVGAENVLQLIIMTFERAAEIRLGQHTKP